MLIDGNSLLNRAFYATSVFTTSSGTPTNAIFGFTKLILKIIEDNKPEYLIVAFDLKGPTFRHKMYDGYKATRKPMPEELAAQVQPLKSLLAAMNIAICEKQGIEADDIIGTLSNKFDVHSYIYTGDRDSYQLVDEKTDVFFTKRGVSDLTKLDKNNFKSIIGINPEQVVDLKALMGDSSDNIPGVAGIGEKTAMSMITSYGSLDGVYDHLDELKPSARKKLEDNKDMAYLSYKLATINRNCELDIQLENCRTPEKFGYEVKKLFADFEFKSLLNLKIFSDDCADCGNVEYPEKINLNEYEEAARILSESRDLYVNFVNSTVQFYNGKDVYEFEQMDLLGGISPDKYIVLLKLIFENEDNWVILYDVKRVMHNLDGMGIKVKCKTEDVSVMKYLVDFGENDGDFKSVCDSKLLNYDYSSYCLKLVYDEYFKLLQQDETLGLYREIESPLISVLFNMENTGVRVSIDELNSLGDKYAQAIRELSEKIYEQCGCRFNINSPSQLGDVLFDKLGLKSGKKNKRGKYSTNAETLETLAEDNEVVRNVLKFRQYNKLYSTYIEGFRPLIKRERVHTTYNQTVTSTGRLSSTNPNMQNIPIREDEGREIRKMFIPSDGCVFIDADYSQIELRLLAHFSGCKQLIEAYNNGEDVHAFTASQVFGVPLNEVTPKMRREAKAVNFGIIYGISEFGLSKNIGVSVATARDYIAKYFERYPEVKEYMNKNIEFAKEHGYVCTLTGRKRVINELKSSNYMMRQFGERAAMNMPLQGTSADIIKIAMVNVERALVAANLQSRLIIQVHDELVIEAPENEVEQATQILKYEMENAVKLNVPLTVDVNIGNNWYDAK